MDAPARARVGPDARRPRRCSWRPRPHAMPHGVVLYVVPERRRPRAGRRRRRGSSSPRSKGCPTRPSERAVLPFPSQEVDPYRGMAPHFGVASARARALHALASGTARVVVASAAALLPRVSAPERLLERVDRAQARPGDRADRSRPSCSSTPASRREDPVDEHGEFAIRGGILDVFPAGETPAGPPRVHRRHDRVAATLRPGDAAVDRSRSIRSPIVPLRDVLDGRPVGATLFDYLAQAQGVAHHRVGARRGRRARARSSSSSVAAQLRGSEQPPGSRCADAGRAARRLEPVDAVWLGATNPGSQLAIDEPRAARRRRPDGRRRAARPLPAGRRAARPRRATGWPRSGGSASEGETMLFVAATPGRAERTVELLKEYDVFAVPVERAEDARYAAVLVAIGRLSRGFRLPDAGLQIYAEADVFEEERRAPERRRSADQGVPVRPARPQGRRPRRPRRPRHRRVRRPEADRRRRQRCRSSSSCATPATTSCSSRSSGSISSRSTPAARGRRSIGWAARRGSTRRRASRRPCATWPRSC